MAGSVEGSFLQVIGDCGNTLGVLWAVPSGVCSVSFGATERADMGAEQGAGHLPVGVLDVV